MEKTMTEARADALMEDGFHCSQCVFPYAAFRLGMDRDEALRLSAGLGGGCFHVFYHKESNEFYCVDARGVAPLHAYQDMFLDKEEADKLLIEKVHEFQKRFLEENGSLLCRQLLGGYDKADPDAVAPDDAYDNCARYCASACRILDSLIGDRYIR